MKTLIYVPARTIVVLIAMLVAPAMHAAFCSPPAPTPNERRPQPDNSSCCDLPCGDCNGSPLFAKTGVYTTSATDLQIPTNGFPLSVSRSYESSHLVDGSLGIGWRSNLAARLYYATYLLVAPATYMKEAVIVMPDGESYRYREETNGSFTPPTGRRDTLVKNGDGTFQLTLQQSNVRYEFAADGALVTIKDELGNTLRFGHDPSRRVATVHDESGTGRSLTVTWNPSGRIGSVQDHTGRVVSYAYSPDGRLSGVTNAAGQTTAYAYQQRRFAPQLTSITDHWGRTVASVTWDSLDRVQTYTEEGETYTLTYNTGSTSKTHTKGTQTITYDANGLVTSRGGGAMAYTADGDLTGSGNVQYTYLTGGRVATVTYGNAAETDVVFHYTYDPTYPYKVARVEPRLRSTPSAYHGHWRGWVYTYYGASDPAPGTLKQIDRLTFQHATQTILAQHSYAEFSYDAKGRVTRSWNRTDGETTYAYDDAVSTMWQYDASNGNYPRATTYVYDSLGRTSSVTDPLGNATSYEYDSLDRVKKLTLPKPNLSSTLNFVTNVNYDATGTNPALAYTETTDPNGAVTKQGYDAFGRLVESIDALGHITTYTYNNGLLNSITDANANVTSYDYDSHRRLWKTIFPDGKVESYLYWSDGKLRYKTDRKAATTEYVYDPFGRLKSQITGTKSRQFGFEGEKLIQVADSYSGTTDVIGYTYHPSTFLPHVETQGVGTPRGTITQTWSTSMDRLNTYTVSDASLPNDNQTATYSHNPDGSVRTITWSRGPGTYALTYDAAGRQTNIAFPNGQSRGSVYDNQGRLKKIANVLGSTNLATFDYEYDKNNDTGQFTQLGQRTKSTASVPALGSTTVWNYFYDTTYQLVRATTSSPTSTERSWTYDGIGNRLTQTVGGGTTSYTYLKNGANTNNGSRLETAGANSFAHDFNGNMTSGFGGIAYTWDVMDRLSSRDSGQPVTFTYDGQDRRTKISHQSTKFLYRGLDPVTVGYTKAGLYHRSDYLFGPGIDEPLGRVDSQAVTYYSVDGLGSVVLLSNAQGQVKNKYSYLPWGEIQTASEELVQPFAYTGREWATLDSGVTESQYYYRARYTAPGVGRFLTEDPLRFIADPNFYRYVLNDPVTFTDPEGLICQWQVRSRPTRGVPDTESTRHQYFFNTQTRQAVGLTTGSPIRASISPWGSPGRWERRENPRNRGDRRDLALPDGRCGCVDDAIRRRGPAPRYCTVPQRLPEPGFPPCNNCQSWVAQVLSSCP